MQLYISASLYIEIDNLFNLLHIENENNYKQILTEHYENYKRTLQACNYYQKQQQQQKPIPYLNKYYNQRKQDCKDINII